MLIVRRQQHLFSTHERVFLWKCQSFRDRKCLDLRGSRTLNHWIHAEGAMFFLKIKPIQRKIEPRRSAKQNQMPIFKVQFQANSFKHISAWFPDSLLFICCEVNPTAPHHDAVIAWANVNPDQTINLSTRQGNTVRITGPLTGESHYSNDKWHQSSTSLAFCEANPPVTSGFSSQRTNNAECFRFMTSSCSGHR